MSLPRSRWPHLCLTSTILAVLGLLSTSCGIDVDEEAQVVPGAVEELQRPDAVNQGAGNNGSFKVLLYFVDTDNNFYAVQQSFSTAPTVNDLLDGIASSPVGWEDLRPDIDDDTGTQSLNLITSLNEKMNPKSGVFDPVTGQLTVTMSAEANLNEENPARRTNIFTQIVCTLTHEDLEIEIDSVLVLEGNGEEAQPIYAQDAKGAPNNGPSTRNDYACGDAQVLAEPAIESDTQTKRALELKEANS